MAVKIEMQRYLENFYGSCNLIIVQPHFYHSYNCSYVYPHDLVYNYCLPFGLKLETYCIILHGQALFSIKAATEITLVGLK